MRQFRTHLLAKVRADERMALGAWVPQPLLSLFDAMPVADRRHGLDVVASLRASGGGDDPELLLAGLLHDCGKSTPTGQAGLPAALGFAACRLGRSVRHSGRGWSERPAGCLASARPSTSSAITPTSPAGLVLAAGGSARTADLIRDQASVPGDRARELLRLADEAN